jgi:hypothetical protein
MRIATIVFAVIVIVAGVAAALYAVDDGGEPAKAATPTSLSPSTAAFGKRVLPRVVADTSSATRTLSHDHPLRLWVGGDSLAGLLGPALGDQVGATGVVSTRVDYKVSSGLWSNDLRNWPDRAAEEMKTDDPEAVVYIIGANDTAAVNNVDANHNGVPDWEEAYRAKVDRMMNEFTGSKHRTVFWLGAPTLGNGMDAQAVEINRVVKEEALKHAPDVVYVDTYHLLSGPDGKYSREIVDEKGRTIVARIADGVHFTQDGSAYLARAVFALIEARFHVVEHADRAHPIAWSFASGSGELVPGYNQAPRSIYGTSSCCNNSSTHTTYQNSGGGYSPTTYVSDPPTTSAPPSPPTTSASPPPPPPPPPPPTTVASPPTT